MKGFLSRKFLVTILTGIVDILALTKVIPTEATGTGLVILNSISGIYVIIEGLIDGLKK
jgi:hypothetical protein